VKALIPDKSSDILVHFGDTDFLDRYHKYQAHLAEWRTQYPKLSSVDMRYDRQVVLEMQPGSAVPAGAASNVKPVADVKDPAVASKPVGAGLKPAGVKSPVVAGKTPTSVAKSAASTATHVPVVKSAAGPKSAPGVKSGNGAVTATVPAAASAAQAKPVVASNESHWVTSSKGSGVSKTAAAKGKAGKPVVKTPAKATSKTAAKTGHASTALHPVGPGVKQ
jgi:cell division protein FtsQ